MSEVLEKPLVEMITPLQDRIVVKRAVEEEKSKGGIVIPDTAKEKPVRGVVVAIGPGKRLESGEIQPLSVKLDDEILFGKYAGTEVKLENQDYIVMREDDVMAIMKK
ncbi:10 kDa chaperonin [Candidatus Rickettsiella viridis]|uniref:Co-chaperonin GroES n=1 Tax=Candidatus Rickettsiella viridis TaxID=676208 RepID=A0A2Z5UW25_9COXI|nr:co-chaperone GroES [Candidatus Rickettsiella viridis]BBB15654.1 10 kDa chaperonin [Candidatus Rickettsiella viridis]